MGKKAFEDLRPIQQADVSILVDQTIGKMIKHQFSNRHMAAFVELIQERISNLFPVNLEAAYKERGQSETGLATNDTDVTDHLADDAEEI